MNTAAGIAVPVPAPTLFGSGAEALDEEPRNPGQLWHAFMTARTLLAILLLLMQSALYLTGDTKQTGADADPPPRCVPVAAALRLRSEPPRLRQVGRFPWLEAATGPDIPAFAALQFLQGSSSYDAPSSGPASPDQCRAGFTGAGPWGAGGGRHTVAVDRRHPGLFMQTRSETIAHLSAGGTDGGRSPRDRDPGRSGGPGG